MSKDIIGEPFMPEGIVAFGSIAKHQGLGSELFSYFFSSNLNRPNTRLLVNASGLVANLDREHSWIAESKYAGNAYMVLFPLSTSGEDWFLTSFTEDLNRVNFDNVTSMIGRLRGVFPNISQHHHELYVNPEIPIANNS